MARSLFALAGWLLACVAFAVPAPQPFVSGWSSPVNPDRDCKIRRDKGALTFEMPGTDHDYDPRRKQFNAPSIFRELEGDFDMQVRVRIGECDFLRGLRAVHPTGTDNSTLSPSRTTRHDRNDFRPSAQSSAPGQTSFVAAGFLLIPPEYFATNCIRLEYGVSGQGIGADGYAADLNCSVGGGYSHLVRDKHIDPRRNWPFKSKPRHIYLRLEREHDILLYQISPDCKEWVIIGGGQILGLPSKLKVGLAAFTTSSEPSKVRFDQLKLTRAKKKSK